MIKSDKNLVIYHNFLLTSMFSQCLMKKITKKKSDEKITKSNIFLDTLVERQKIEDKRQKY